MNHRRNILREVKAGRGGRCLTADQTIDLFETLDRLEVEREPVHEGEWR